jgi:hypothetical protein
MFLRSGRRLIVAAALTCAAIALPVAALAASPHGTPTQPGAPTQPGTASGPATTPGPPAAASAARCGNAQPALPGGGFVWSSRPGDAFAGGVAYEIEITNVGRHACTLRGTPGLAAARGNGQLVGGKVPVTNKGPVVTLAPGATAHFGLIVHDADVCARPVSAHVVVYLPGQNAGQGSALFVSACPGRQGGGVLDGIGPIAPGAGIPLYDI